MRPASTPKGKDEENPRPEGDISQEK